MEPSRKLSNGNGAFPSLQAKMLMLIFIALIPSLGLLLYSTNLHRADLITETKDKIIDVSHSAANNLEKIAEGSRYLLTALANSPSVQNLDSSASNMLFADILKTLPLHATILAIKPNGDVFASGVPFASPLNNADFPYFQEVAKTHTFSFGNYQIGRIVNKPVIIAAYPVLDKNDKLLAVVACSLDLAKLNNDLEKISIPGEGVLTVIDSNGTILAQNPDPEKKWLGKILPDKTIVKAALNNNNNNNTEEMAGLDGVQRLYSFVPIIAAENKLHVIYGISIQEALAPANKAYTINLLLFAATLLLSVFVALYVSRLATAAQEKINASAYDFLKLSANVPGMIYQFTRRPDGTYFVPVASEGIKDLFGCEPKDVADDFSPIAKTILPEDLDRVMRDIEYSAKHMEPFSCEYRVHIPGKSIQWLLAKAEPEKLANGFVTWYGFNADITERKNAETVALELKNRNEAILKSIGDAVFATDKGGTIMLFNKTAEKMTGVAAEKAIGNHYSRVMNFIKESDGKPANDFIAEAIKNNKITEMANHVLLVRKDGTTLPVADSAAPIIGEGGDIMGCVVVFQDMTKERQIDKAKTEFVSLASHQLRTPPTAISWYTELLLKEDFGMLNEKQKEYVSEIRHSNIRMIDLINSLLNISRIELGTFAIQPEYVRLSTIIDSTLKDLQIEIEQKEIAIEKKYKDEDSPIECDPRLVQIIFQNILSNAAFYSPPNGKISIHMKKIEGGTRIDIQDNGCGIPRDMLSRIFTKFFRADNARNMRPDGSGLGLYITKSITEALGGTITFVSEENKGTIFSITLPDTCKLRDAPGKIIH